MKQLIGQRWQRQDLQKGAGSRNGINMPQRCITGETIFGNTKETGQS